MRPRLPVVGHSSWGMEIRVWSQRRANKYKQRGAGSKDLESGWRMAEEAWASSHPGVMRGCFTCQLGCRACWRGRRDAEKRSAWPWTLCSQEHLSIKWRTWISVNNEAPSEAKIVHSHVKNHGVNDGQSLGIYKSKLLPCSSGCYMSLDRVRIFLPSDKF